MGGGRTSVSLRLFILGEIVLQLGRTAIKKGFHYLCAAVLPLVHSPPCSGGGEA